MRIFCNALEHRLGQIPTDQWDKPLKEPLCEFGYAIRVVSRMRQHLDHKSSNYIMNLCESVCKTLFHNKYCIKNWVVCFIPYYMMLELAEIFITIAGQGYVHDGCGFSHQHAGESVEPGNRMSEEDCEECANWTKDNMDVEQRTEELLDQMKKIEEENREAIWCFRAAKARARQQQQDVKTLLGKMRATLQGKGDFNVEEYGNKLEQVVANLQRVKGEREAEDKERAENPEKFKEIDSEECIVM